MRYAFSLLSCVRVAPRQVEGNPGALFIAYLIQFFGRKTRLGNYIARIFWEAVVGVFHIADVYHVTDLVPEVVCV